MPGNASIQSVSRAARILFAVAGAEGGRTIRQIADAVGLNASTTYRLITTLEEEELLARTPSPLRFRLGRGLEELRRLEEESHLIAVASRVLVKHQLRLPETNFGLVEQVGGEIFQRVRVMSNRPGVASVRRASLLRPYEKASGLVFLAWATSEEQAEFFRRHPFAKEGAKLWGTQTRLWGFLADTRRLGYALPEFPDGDFHRIAAPVFDRDERLVAVVGAYVGVTADAKTKAELERRCLLAAREIRRAL